MTDVRANIGNNTVSAPGRNNPLSALRNQIKASPVQLTSTSTSETNEDSITVQSPQAVTTRPSVQTDGEFLSLTLNQPTERNNSRQSEQVPDFHDYIKELQKNVHNMFSDMPLSLASYSGRNIMDYVGEIYS